MIKKSFFSILTWVEILLNYVIDNDIDYDNVILSFVLLIMLYYTIIDFSRGKYIVLFNIDQARIMNIYIDTYVHVRVTVLLEYMLLPK